MKHFLLISFLLWLVATAHSTLPPTAAEIQQAVREAATDYVGDFVGQWVWRRVLYSGALDGPGTRTGTDALLSPQYGLASSDR